MALIGQSSPPIDFSDDYFSLTVRFRTVGPQTPIPTIFLTGRKLGSNLLKREKYAEPGAPGGMLPGVKNAPLTCLSWCLMIPEHARFIHPAPVTHCRCLTPFCTLNAPARNSPGNQSASEISCNILVTKDTHNSGG